MPHEAQWIDFLLVAVLEVNIALKVEFRKARTLLNYGHMLRSIHAAKTRSHACIDNHIVTLVIDVFMTSIKNVGMEISNM